MWPTKPKPRYNHVQTRLADDTYDALRQYATKNKVNYCKAAEVLIAAALKITGDLAP